MHGRTIKVGVGVLAAAAAGALVFPTSAFADYAPAPHDVVGVGSDTLQALGNFVADGTYAFDTGFNAAGSKFKFISIDATADANTRLAYGPAGALGTGVGGTTGCGPGTGGGIGTGNATGVDTTASHLPCVLAPSVVLRAGSSPEQRPNGSGAGYKLLNADTTSAGAAIGDSGWGLVNFSRASSAQNASNANFDSITVGTDNLAILSSALTGTNATHAVALSKAQLAAIYNCTSTVWTAVGGTSANTIYAMLPQVGSGTRKQFLADIGVTTPGSCVHNVEENDPLAINDSGVPADAIEPMAGTRLNLFQGKGGAPAGGSISTGQINPTGYFNDPTCPFNPTTSSQTGVAGTANAPTQCQGAAAALAPSVNLWLTGTPSDTQALYVDNRPLYIYFRHADTFSGTTWQPGGNLNWVRTMFYNPCTAGITSTTIIPPSNTAAFNAAGCTIDPAGNPVGAGGDPYFASAAAQQDISDAGVNPTWVYNLASV